MLSLEAVAILQSTAVFAGLPPAELRTFATATHEQRFDARAYVFQEGDAALCFCIVVTGRIPPSSAGTARRARRVTEPRRGTRPGSPVVRGVASVDGQDDAGDPARLVGGQKQGGVRDVAGLAEPAKQVLVEQPLPRCPLGPHPVEHRAVDARDDERRAERVDADAVLAEVDRQLLREDGDGPLRRRVGGADRQADDAGDRRKVHERPAPLADHRRQDGAAHEEHALHVHPHRLVPGGLGGLEDGFPGGEDPGVVDEDVDAAEALERHADDPLGVGARRDARLHGEGLAAGRPDRIDHRVVGPRPDVHADDPGALLREAPGDGLAEPHRGSRDDGDLAVQSG